jgi:hypothetical protein
MASTWAINAQATPMLSLSDGTHTLVIVDDQPNDFLPLPGEIGFVGSLGFLSPFTIFQLTAGTKPVVGSPSAPVLDMPTVWVDSVFGGGTLTIQFTDTDFTGTPSGFEGEFGGFLAHAGGPTDNTLTYSSFLDSSNTPFGTEMSLWSQTFFGGFIPGSISSSVTPSASPYSLTQTLVLTLTTPGQLNANFRLEALAVPEPSLPILLGSSLAGMVLLTSRRPKRQES